jgi:hypothetical protein
MTKRSKITKKSVNILVSLAIAVEAEVLAAPCALCWSSCHYDRHYSNFLDPEAIAVGGTMSPEEGSSFPSAKTDTELEFHIVRVVI